MSITSMLRKRKEQRGGYALAGHTGLVADPFTF